jgi:hypothetical protein
MKYEQPDACRRIYGKMERAGRRNGMPEKHPEWNSVLWLLVPAESAAQLQARSPFTIFAPDVITSALTNELRK